MKVNWRKYLEKNKKMKNLCKNSPIESLTNPEKLYFQNFDNKEILDKNTTKILQEGGCPVDLHNLYYRNSASIDIDNILQRQEIFREFEKPEVQEVLNPLREELWDLAINGACAEKDREKEQSILLNQYVSCLQKYKDVKKIIEKTDSHLVKNIFSYLSNIAYSSDFEEAKKIVKKYKIKGNGSSNLHYKTDFNFGKMMNLYTIEKTKWPLVEMLERNLDLTSGYVYWIAEFKKKGFDFCYPKFVSKEENLIDLKGARLIDTCNNIPPIDLYMDNMKGLSFPPGTPLQNIASYTKLISQIQFLAQSGFPVPAKSARLSLVDKI